MATAGRDGLVKVWSLPKDGQLSADLTVAEYYLAGHEKRVELLKFHSTATDLLLTASAYDDRWTPHRRAAAVAIGSRAGSPGSKTGAGDRRDLTLRLWDFREMREIQALEGFDEASMSIAWSLYGAHVLQASKDGVVQLFDPRASAQPQQVRDRTRRRSRHVAYAHGYRCPTHAFRWVHKRPTAPTTWRPRASM